MTDEPLNKPVAGQSKGGFQGKMSAPDAQKLRELVSRAGQERKSLQLLVEYFENKSGELGEKKHFFEKITSQIPDTLEKLESLNSRISEIRDIDGRVSEFQKVSKELNSNYVEMKRELDQLHLLHEHIDQKNKSLNQQRGLVEKANEDAGRLGVLIWDMDSKIKKLNEDNKLVKVTDRNINRLETMLDSVSKQVDQVGKFREMMNKGSQDVESMKGLMKELETKFNHLHQEKDVVSSYCRDMEVMRDVLETTQMDTEKLLGQQHVVGEANENVARLIREINELKIESKNVSVKSEMIRTVGVRFRELDSLVVEVEKTLL